MRSRNLLRRRRACGFTLIELLVVVAIIALLISILLPSLSKARAQARTTLCATRVAQMTKSMLVYANDYDGRPPFTGTGDVPSDCADDKDAVDLEYWLTQEQWIVANNPESDWPSLIDDWRDGYVPRSGLMFSYTRFENLYRCPEFERQNNGEKTQNVFNITRSILGRKWWVSHLDPDIPDDLRDHEQTLGVMGEILPLSSIHAPGKLEMMFDEHWKYHVADCYMEFERLGGAWQRSDPVFYGAQSEIGRYHGQPVQGWVAPFPDENDPELPPAGEIVGAVKRGNVGFYDGHVALERDFLPGKNVYEGLLNADLRKAIIDWIISHRFFQRGRAENIDEFVPS